MREKMFVVPGSFVPYNDTVTLLTYKRLRNLDLDMDVFCFKGKTDQSIEEELRKDPAFSKFHITYTSDLDWAIARNHPLRLPVSLVLMQKYIRDSVREFEKKDYKYLFTSIVPGISHIAGLAIKRKHPEVIWYASFSDPFKGSPYKKTDLSNKSLLYKIAFPVGSYCLYHDNYEEAAVKNADKLIFICPEQRDFTLSQYEDGERYKEKSIIYPLTYLENWKMYQDLLDYEPVKHEVKQAVHLGRLYGLRKIDAFLEALKELNEEIKDLDRKIVFHQYSEIQKEDVQKIREYGLDRLFIVHGKVSYKESIDLMKEADILVLFDTLMPKENVQPYLPSKIVEYLMLKKAILGICDPNSPSYRILKEYGYDTVGSQKETIKANIIRLLNEDKNYDHSLTKLNNDHYDKVLIG
ncbi:MAG: hypothetical protein IKS51_01125 [Erysipelotrichaceae bacterium]|nr:hypothetical protein [Erysipelotrichaceae bacterium]